MEQVDDHRSRVATRLVESRMRWKPHVRFGGRPGETDRWKQRHGAPVRSHWATDALDEVRRDVWNAARRDGGDRALAEQLKGCRYALWKNPDNLTGRQCGKLAWVARTNRQLYRAYLLKEELRLAIRIKGDQGISLLAHWLNWASHSQIPAFAELARKIRRHRVAIEQALRSGTTNALVESTNTKIRVLTRMAFGFRSPEALIAMAMLAVGGVCPDLPGRTTPIPSEPTTT